jgi:hypothetical protein
MPWKNRRTIEAEIIQLGSVMFSIMEKRQKQIPMLKIPMQIKLAEPQLEFILLTIGENMMTATE